jgi:hypothetical protein
VKNLPIIERVTVKNIIFNYSMQFKIVTDGFILNVYCKNETHDDLGTYDPKSLQTDTQQIFIHYNFNFVSIILLGNDHESFELKKKRNYDVEKR